MGNGGKKNNWLSTEFIGKIGGNHSRWSDGREDYEHKCRQCLHDARHAAIQTNNVSSAIHVISCE